MIIEYNASYRIPRNYVDDADDAMFGGTTSAKVPMTEKAAEGERERERCRDMIGDVGTNGTKTGRRVRGGATDDHW